MPRKSIRGPHDDNTSFKDFARRRREPRNVHYTITLSPVDLDDLQELADKAGIALSDTIRWCLFEGFRIALKEAERWDKDG